MRRLMIFALGLLFVSAFFLSIGCGDKQPKRVQVGGQVLIDGKPLEHGFIRLIPTGARPSVAKIGSDGRFQLACYGNADGAVLGTHKVTVSGWETLSPTARKWHAPKKYSDPSTSGLTATIDATTKELKFELTWNGGHPFVENTKGGE